jgi:hypothetical protein
LNEKFIEVIRRGPEKAVTYGCGHGTLYRLAQATVLHEIAHLLDLRTHFPYSPGFQKELETNLAMCEVNVDASSRECGYYKKIRSRISETREYLNKIGWSYQGGRFEPKNNSRRRSPAPYEYASPFEHFAVNMEYYLLDPEYQCRRPTLAKYFDDLFAHRPFANDSCRIPTKIMYSFTPATTDLNPARIYQIHYLLADKGEDWSSKFGHSMFRIVGCAPQTPVGPECLKDLSYHSVVSFRFNATDVVKSNFKALTGKYLSQAFIYPMIDIVGEYNIRQDRNLLSYQLNLSRTQIKQFLYKTLEAYWDYSGSYFYLTNNCATESRDLLQAILPEHDLSTDGIVTPTGLLAALEKAGLVDPSIDWKDQSQGQTFFSSYKAQLDYQLSRLTKVLPEVSAFSVAELDTWKAAGRYSNYLSLLARFPGRKTMLTGTLLAMELLFEERERRSIQFKNTTIFMEAREGRYPTLKPLLDELAGLLIKTQPSLFTHAGYGIPVGELEVDRMALETIPSSMNKFTSAIALRLEELRPDDYREVQAIQQNIGKYISALKKVGSESPLSHDQ